MRWYNSIITKISLIFLFALFGVFAILYTFANYQIKRELQNAEQFAQLLFSSSYDKSSGVLDLERLKKNGLVLITNPELKRSILRKRHFFRTHQRRTGRVLRSMGLFVRAIVYKDSIYISLRDRSRRVMLFKTPLEKETFSPLMVSVFTILFLIILYIVTIKNILPIYALKKKIKRFADGDYEIDCSSRGRDEIGVLSNEFNEAVKKIKRLRDSRQLFLRNIMHELKTPIAKGKFVTEIVEDRDLKLTLQNIFNRQEYLIDELARIEKLDANELKLDKKEYLLEDVVDFSLDILNQDRANVDVDIKPLKIEVDFELFGTAIKNLLDNGIKYSTDSRVKISNDGEKILITNRGEELEFPLESYSKPYFLKGKKQMDSRGLGFGLYIVWHILRLHSIKFSYKRELKKNIFEILLK